LYIFFKVRNLRVFCEYFILRFFDYNSEIKFSTGSGKTQYTAGCRNVKFVVSPGDRRLEKGKVFFQSVGLVFCCFFLCFCIACAKCKL